MIRSSVALLAVLGLLTAGYVWATFKPSAPFTVFATAVATVAAQYFTKRLVQKRKEFNGKQVADED